MTDLEYPPQQKRKARVKLLSRLGATLLDRRVEIHTGEPIGDWTEFRGIRIALKRMPRDRFEGIVPDSTD